MPTPKELLDAGRLDTAIEALTQEVKANPADVTRRIFLFELLCFAGQWDRAEKQIDVLGSESAQASLAVQVYKSNVAAEKQRVKLYREGAAPHFLNEPPAYADMQVEGIRKLASGDAAAARELFDRAEDERPSVAGTWNGKAFLDFRDYDDAIGGMLELIVKDKYAWLPFEQIRSIEMRPPSKLRDLLWIPTRIEALDGTIGEVFVPALYAGTSQGENDSARLGRMTDWKEIGEGLYAGVGQRLFLVDDSDEPVLELRKIEFGANSGEATPS
ncbi:MAG TPA: type VI secretion system accessory protein TagJ [Thermoanaerobaculia bacterium]|nr:type VI secretion system accessory protein TagJ [Thermoanaerobaculia bacterium]